VEHVVFYTAADGSPAYRRTANLDDAVRVVEHLRNAEGREEVHVYSLAPVGLNFRPYYRVEINGAAQPEAPAFSAPVAEAPQAAELQSVSAELAAFASPAEEPQHVAAPAAELPVPMQPPFVEQPPFAAPSAPPAPQPMGAFMPMPAAGQPMPPAPEQVPAMAAAGQPEADAEQNGESRGRSLGFFTR
jgi:hypothetical protein